METVLFGSGGGSTSITRRKSFVLQGTAVRIEPLAATSPSENEKLAEPPPPDIPPIDFSTQYKP